MNRVERVPAVITVVEERGQNGKRQLTSLYPECRYANPDILATPENVPLKG